MSKGARWHLSSRSYSCVVLREACTLPPGQADGRAVGHDPALEDVDSVIQEALQQLCPHIPNFRVEWRHVKCYTLAASICSAADSAITHQTWCCGSAISRCERTAGERNRAFTD